MVYYLQMHVTALQAALQQLLHQCNYCRTSVSDYLDPDAPDPALYPKGMLLWNLRRSGFNVKRFERNYIDTNADNSRCNVDDVDQDGYILSTSLGY